MESEARYALVGTVVLVLLAAMVAAVVWLRRAGGADDVNHYKIYFARQSLDGLQLRSDVKMRGIVVGSVESFRISSWKKGSVEVVVRVDEQAPVRETTKAVVDRQLVTGLASITLVTADEDAPLLVKAPETEPYPLIEEGESDYEQLSQSASQLAQNAGETLGRVNELLSAGNRAALVRTLEAIERLSVTAERNLKGLDRTLAEVAAAAKEVQGLRASLSESTATLTARYDELGKESTATVREVRASAQRMAEDIAKLSARADTLLAGTSAEVGSTAQEVRLAARSLGAAARRFRDPRAILVGPAQGDLGPGEAR